MKTTAKEPGKLAKNMGLLGIGLCALCCALPIIGIVGGAGILVTIALYAEKIASVLLIISAASFAIWHYRRRQTPPACDIDCDCKTENIESKSTTELKAK
jgi:ABC-type nickel/cobalt efflux system permease component RcnA